MQKHILLTNDDGFESPGLHALAQALKPLAHVTIVAPTTEKSACAHSLTLTRPLRFVQIDDDFFKLDDGTPSDCVYLALHVLFCENKWPDLIVSGINIGANMGEDVTYSGTAAAAMEGVLQGVPSIAFSQAFKRGEEVLKDFQFELAKQTAYDLVKRVLTDGFPLPPREFLNVNIPYCLPSTCKGIRTTKYGKREYGNEAHLHRNPRGLEYCWIGAPNLGWEASKDGDCDLSAVENGYVSITPTKLDLSAYESMEKLEKWLK